MYEGDRREILIIKRCKIRLCLLSFPGRFERRDRGRLVEHGITKNADALPPEGYALRFFADGGILGVVIVIEGRQVFLC